MQVHVPHLFAAKKKRTDENNIGGKYILNKIGMRAGVNVSPKYVYLSLILMCFPFVHNKNTNIRILRVKS